MAERPAVYQGPNVNQNYGGMPDKLVQFEVKEHEVTNQPDSNRTWNEKMGNPVGPK